MVSIIFIICLPCAFVLWYLLAYSDDIVFEIKDRKRTRFATKALQSDDGMMRYIQKLVKIEYCSEKTKDNDRLRILYSQRQEMMEYLYYVLADMKEDTELRTSYMDTLCKMKTVVKNYYQAGEYKQAADNTIAYLGDYKVK